MKIATPSRPIPGNLSAHKLINSQTFKLPKIVGILNITPDSFYDGGRYWGPEAAWRKFLDLEAQGADIVDIGGESSRPGSVRISEDEELVRLGPVLKELSKLPRLSGSKGLGTCQQAGAEGLNEKKVLISIDTVKSRVACAAINAGAIMINDTSALRHDPEGMLDILTSRKDVRIVLMHMQGEPQNMQISPRYDDVFGEIAAFFEERMLFLEKNNVSRERVILDPGIGFGKTLEHNLAILGRIGDFKSAFHRPVMIGASRKSFIASVLDGAVPNERLEGSLAAALWGTTQGVDYLRVHDVLATRRTLQVWSALSMAQIANRE